MTILNIRWTLSIVCVLSAAWPTAESSAAPDNAEAALRLIYEAADQICGPYEKKGSGQEVELSGGAKAELSKVLKKLANIGIEGSAKYRTGEYEGVLQQDLAKVLTTTSDCRRDVFLSLRDVLLVSKQTGETSDRASARAKSAVRNPRQYHWQCEIDLFNNADGTSTARGRLDFGPITYGANVSYARASFSALHTSRIPKEIGFERAAWAFMGSDCKPNACMSFVDESPPYDPVFIVQNVIFDEERGEIDLRGGVMVRTEGQHQWFAYLTGSCKPR